MELRSWKAGPLGEARWGCSVFGAGRAFCPDRMHVPIRVFLHKGAHDRGFNSASRREYCIFSLLPSNGEEERNSLCIHSDSDM